MEHLSPRQVALAIGVSEASLKRWCDKGVIESTRTVGGHRRLPMHAVVGFLQKSGRPLVRPEILGLPSTTGTGKTVSNRAVTQGTEALIAGDEQAFRRVICDLHLAGQPIPSIADRVIAPVLTELGRRWEAGALETYKERRACEICVRTLHRMHWLFSPAAPTAPLAIGGAGPGDWFAIPSLLAELTLRDAAWRADSLGVNLPLATLAAAARELRPRLIWLSASWMCPTDSLGPACAELRSAVSDCGAALVVGGRGVGDELRLALPEAILAGNMTQLATVARELVGDPLADQIGSSPSAVR